MINYIQFDKVSTVKHDLSKKMNMQTLSLFDNFSNFNVFDLMPKYFIISTNSGTSKFNTEILTNTSSIINEQFINNPQNLQYHLDINDDKNVLQKFEQIYQGKFVIFNEEDIFIANTIIESLNIQQFPSLINAKSTENKGIMINRHSFIKFLKNETLQRYTIKTSKNEYKCNIFGVLSSKTIREHMTKYSFNSEYTYKFEDECEEFQLISDIFNFKKVKMTSQNKESLKEISDDLRIESISNKIDMYIQKVDNFYEKVDNQQESIELIEEMFYLLYHIKEKTVESLKLAIIQSFWCQTIENVQELASFIIQVVNTDFSLHPYLSELIFELDKESNDNNKLNLLVPYIIKILMISFGQTTFNCSFVFNLYKKGFIEKSDIINRLKEFFNRYENANLISYNCKTNNDCDEDDQSAYYHQEVMQNLADELEDYNYYSDSDDYIDSSEISDNFDVIKILNLYLWFLPEIIEIKRFYENILDEAKSQMANFINSFLPDKIEDYKRMRDRGEPDDEITKILRNDEVDKLQSIISNIENPKLIVPFNIYENFVPNGETDFLNYSAAYGSIKCFKYLLLNYIKCDESTFNFAVYGGNIEIIKIADYQKEFKVLIVDDNTSYQKKILKSADNIKYNSLFNINYISSNRNMDIYKIIPAIIKHNDELFDWIFEQKFSMKKNDDDSIKFLLILSAYNGNVHSFIRILNNDFNISKKLINLTFQDACGNGFHRFSKIIFKTMKKSSDNSRFNSFASIYYGNLSIFKFSLNLMLNQMQLEKAFILAVTYDHRNIIDYYFDKLLKENFKFNKFCIIESINSSLMRESSDLFFYLIEKFNQTNEFKIDILNLNQTILENGCLFGNDKGVKFILDAFLSCKENDLTKFNFTALFFKATNSESIELCRYLIDLKIPIDFVFITKMYKDLSSVNPQIFSLILQNCNSIAKQQLLHFHFIPAISKKKYEVVELMLKENASNNKALFEAIKNEDIEMVKLILKYKKEPSFINELSYHGTALCLAASNSNLEIIKVLLSIPGIDVNLCDNNGNSPLMIVFPDLKLMEPFLNFYGDDFIHQTRLIHFIINELIYLLRVHKSTAFNVIERLIKFEGICFNEIIEENNLLYAACSVNDCDIVKLLLSLDNMDPNVQIPESFNTPLINSIIHKNVEIAKILINDKRTNINSKNSKGETALLLAVNNNEDEIIDLLLNNDKLDLIQNNFDEIFIKTNNKYRMKIISLNIFDVNHLLFTNGDDVFCSSDSSNGTLLTYSYSYSDESITEDDDNDSNDDNNNRNGNVVNNNNDDDDKNEIKDVDAADVESDDICDDDSDSVDDFENKKTETILFYAVRTDNIEIIDFVIQNPSFDKEKSDLESSIYKSIKDGKLKIFKKLLKLLNEEVNEYNVDKKTLLCYSVSKSRIKIMKEILNHPNFDAKKSQIYNSFFINLEKIKQNSYEIMKVLYEYDKAHDNLIGLNEFSEKGETVFTSINLQSKSSHIKFYNIDKIVNFLIKNGVDPNMPNKEGRYPFQWAIDLESLEFVLSLINSNKIDFSKRVKSLNNATFLHLAAIIRRPFIFKELLKRNVIDINSTDDLNETPLMYSCRFLRNGRIRLLFERDNLDYLHRNKENLDAIEISQIKKRNSDDITDRDIYRRFLLKKSKKIACFKVKSYPKPNLYPALFEIDKNAKIGYKAVFKFVDNSSSIGEFMDSDKNSSSTQNKDYSSSNTSSYFDEDKSLYSTEVYTTESLSITLDSDDESNRNKEKRVSFYRAQSKDKSFFESSSSIIDGNDGDDKKKSEAAKNDDSKVVMNDLKEKSSFESANSTSTENGNNVDLKDPKNEDQHDSLHQTQSKLKDKNLHESSSSHDDNKRNSESARTDDSKAAMSSSINKEAHDSSYRTQSKLKNKMQHESSSSHDDNKKFSESTKADNNKAALSSSKNEEVHDSSHRTQPKPRDKIPHESSSSHDDNKKFSESIDNRNQNLSKLPPLHKKAVKRSVNPSQSNDIAHTDTKDEISRHPLNRPKAKPRPSNDSNPHSKGAEPQSCSALHKEALNLDVNSSPRSKLNRIKVLQNKSENGDAEAQYSLGVCYSLGKGVQVDKEKALQHYLMSANQGHISAQYSAASCYSYGKGTEVNKEKAFELYLRAAEQGFDKAQFAVGHFYEFGQGGVIKDHEKAVEWYQKAANQGHKGSINALNS